MRYAELASLILKELKTLYGANEARSIQRYYLSSFLNIPVASLIKINDDEVESSIENKVLADLERLKKNEPVQYVLGKTWFFDIELKVSKDVLIPRPETEQMVKLIYDSTLKKIATHNILDIGTGSGAIAIALKKLMPDANVTAIDISERALAIASLNAERIGTKIRLIQSDILEMATINAKNINNYNRDIYSLIVSNPPYVKKSEQRLMRRNVLDYEPPLALFVEDSDPLLYYKAIAIYAYNHLSTNGALWLEINETEAANTQRLLIKSGFQSVEILYDMFDKQRFIKAIK